jgi:hypothetical protein
MANRYLEMKKQHEEEFNNKSEEAILNFVQDGLDKEGL